MMPAKNVHHHARRKAREKQLQAALDDATPRVVDPTDDAVIRARHALMWLLADLADPPAPAEPLPYPKLRLAIGEREVLEWNAQPNSAVPAFALLLDELTTERRAQVAAGYGIEHDAHHGIGDLLQLAWDRAHMEGAQSGRFARQRLIEAATMIVAAVETADHHDWWGPQS